MIFALLSIPTNRIFAWSSGVTAVIRVSFLHNVILDDIYCIAIQEPVRVSKPSLRVKRVSDRL